MRSTLYTLGHSTRSEEDFLSLLRENGIACVVDVRRFPGSRRHPHFASQALERSLSASGTAYVHEPALGGYRRPRPDSPNAAWRVATFRGYADHMDTAEFRAALEALMERGGKAPTAILCAEATPWRCHRQLISDALVARGWEVRHIFSPGRSEPHRLHRTARVLPDGRLRYPGEAAAQQELWPES